MGKSVKYHCHSQKVVKERRWLAACAPCALRWQHACMRDCARVCPQDMPHSAGWNGSCVRTRNCPCRAAPKRKQSGKSSGADAQGDMENRCACLQDRCQETRLTDCDCKACASTRMRCRRSEYLLCVHGKLAFAFTGVNSLPPSLRAPRLPVCSAFPAPPLLSSPITVSSRMMHPKP